MNMLSVVMEVVHTHRTFETGLFQEVVDRDIADIDSGPLASFSKHI